MKRPGFRREPHDGWGPRGEAKLCWWSFGTMTMLARIAATERINSSAHVVV